MKTNNEITIEKNDWAVINPMTGEIVNKICEGDKIVRKETQEHLSQYIDNFNKGKSFLKIYDDIMPKLDEKLSANEFKLFMQLIPFASYCCHSPVIGGSFHNIYGTRNNTQEQLDDYIKLHTQK